MSEADSALRAGLDLLALTDHTQNRVDPALDLARFLAGFGRAGEAGELVDTYERWAHERDIPLWDRDFEHIRALISGAAPT